MNDLTHLLERIRGGDSKAAEELILLVYEELRRMAAGKMALEPPGHTLQPTALVHEAWLRLGGDAPQQWQNRSHFISAAGEAMRRVLVESARRRRRLKRGGDLDRVDLDAAESRWPCPKTTRCPGG